MAQEDKKLAVTLKELSEAAKRPEGARNALAMLFPKADEVLDTYVPSDHLDAYSRIRERRISQGEFAHVYFRLDPATVSWSRSELERIIELGPDQGLAVVEERVQKFSEKDSAHLRRLFLDFLAAIFAERDLFNADWFYGLMEWSPAYIRNRERKLGHFFEDDGFLPFNRLLFQAFQRRPQEARFLIVAERLDEIDDLSVFADFFRSTVGDTNPEGATHERQKHFFWG